MSKIPQQIGRYKILSVLGEGAMGVVYCAHDPRLDRNVAIKTIHLSDKLNQTRRTRLVQSLLKESRMAAGLNHPGIVQVFDVGEEQGEPYIVLERIEGTPLSEVIARQGKMECEVATPIMRDLLQAIGYAHQHGVIHRDLKPDNIMVQPDGHVRIMDFGIAHAITDSPADGGTLLGTPRYMSPEQIMGRSVDLRSDLFSLGVIFYELLSGHKPFPQEDFETLREALLAGSYPPLHTVRTDLPAGLYKLVSRALSRNPLERYSDAQPMLEALEQCRPGAAPAADESAPQARSAIIDFILQRIARQGDFPATMQYVSAVTQVAHNANASAHTIAETILKDFALTNRILRMVNSPFYRTSGRSISTISRAVVVLGVNAIVDLAAGLSVFEHFKNRSDVRELKAQSLQALLTAIHAREVARQIHYENVEEAFICGMLHHLGRLIVAFYFPEEYGVISNLVNQNGMEENVASRKVMHVSYRELGQAVAQSWRLPESVLRGIEGLPAEHHGAPLRTPAQKLQGITSYAAGLSRAIMIPDEKKRKAALVLLVSQFEGVIDIKPRHLDQILDQAIRNAWDISNMMNFNLKGLSLDVPPDRNAEANKDRTVPFDEETPVEVVPLPSLSSTQDDPAAPDPAAAAVNRQDYLMKAISEITMALMSPFQINDILIMVLEGMYRGVGSEHVLLALATPNRDRVICRFGLGPDLDRIRQAFNLPLTHVGGLPARCILDAQEIFVADLEKGYWRGALPSPCMELLSPKSLVLLPIMIQDQAIGLFYLDRSADQPPVNKHDLLNLRTLTNQAILAIKQSQSKAKDSPDV